ncbi:hypothetical protein Q8F55_009266 [Vanrija albida]|uniref:BRCT domain-containing protein n=1 Tax=Vanrija albida TaxID=181172 RepID=A0ABR3PT55_9TREE
MEEDESRREERRNLRGQEPPPPSPYRRPGRNPYIPGSEARPFDSNRGVSSYSNRAPSSVAAPAADAANTDNASKKRKVQDDNAEPSHPKIFSDGLDFPVTFYVDPSCSPVLGRMIKLDGGHLTTPDRAHLLVFNVMSAAQLNDDQAELVAKPRFFGSVAVTQEWVTDCILSRRVSGLRAEELVVKKK